MHDIIFKLHLAAGGVLLCLTLCIWRTLHNDSSTLLKDSY